MYKDIITYELADHMTEDRLLKVAGQIVNDWMKKLPGFISWKIHSNGENSFTDIVQWESKDAAKNAEKEMMNIPNAGEWYSCYKEGTIKSQSLTEIAKF